MTRLGALGGGGRVTVDVAGRVSPPGVSWEVMAGDRWFDPASERAVRQTGGPVLETRMRVVEGDAVHRVWVAAGGVPVMEVTNETALPIVVAFDGRDRVERAIGHRTSTRFAVGADPADLPGPGDVARGWAAHVRRGMRVQLPAGRLADAVAANLAYLLMAADDGARSPAVAEALVVWGFPAPLPEHVPTLARYWALTRDRSRVEELVAAADVDRLAPHLARLVEREDPTSDSFAFADDDGGARFLVAVRDGLIDDTGADLAVLASEDVEVHDAPTAFGRLSFAVRFHGQRPALLWELDAHPGLERPTITAPALDPGWSSHALVGEELVMARR